MVRVLRYPRMSAILCVLSVLCALMRDFCVGASLHGWASVLLVITLVLLGAAFAVMSCRLFMDEQGVGVGFLLRVRRTDWEDIASFGVLYCNTRRRYIYGMYRGETDFLNLLHHAPACGKWGFVVPASSRLMSAILRCCPFDVNLAPLPPMKREGKLRPQWHQGAVYALVMIPAAAMAFATAGTMLVHAANAARMGTMLSLSLGAMALGAAGVALLYRAINTRVTCPGFNELGVCAGRGLYLKWDEVRFGYVHRMASASGMFLISRPLDEIKRRGAKPILCLSMPDTTTMVLAYLTYCPHAERSGAEAMTER